jgi:hypothetical protein
VKIQTEKKFKNIKCDRCKVCQVVYIRVWWVLLSACAIFSWQLWIFQQVLKMVSYRETMREENFWSTTLFLSVRFIEISSITESSFWNFPPRKIFLLLKLPPRPWVFLLSENVRGFSTMKLQKCQTLQMFKNEENNFRCRFNVSLYSFLKFPFFGSLMGSNRLEGWGLFVSKVTCESLVLQTPNIYSLFLEATSSLLLDYSFVSLSSFVFINRIPGIL